MDGKEESLAQCYGALCDLIKVMEGIESHLGFLVDAVEDQNYEMLKGKYTPKRDRNSYIAPVAKYRRTIKERD